MAGFMLLAIGSAPDERAPVVTADTVRNALAGLAGAFVPNRGQAPRAVRYHTYGSSPAVAFTPTEAVVQRAGNPSPIRLRFVGANPGVTIEAGRRSGTRINYLLGNDPAKWVSGLPAYGEVVYRELWPGIDLAFDGVGKRLKYEVHIAPGSSVGRIRFSYPVAQRLSLDPRGNLRIHTARGVLREQAPLSYQFVDGRRTKVASRFVLHGRQAYGFALGAGYDPRRSLVIDPALHYSTFIGGFSSEFPQSIAVDSGGHAYVTGSTSSSDFPRTIGPPFAGFQSEGFVAKLSPAGDSLVYATFFGGNSFEVGKSIDVDEEGNAYVVGETGSANFPTTPGAFDRTFGSSQDPFALKLAPTGGALLWSTYLGGPGSEGWVRGKRAPDGTVYVVGSTSALDIVPPGVPSFQPTRNGPTDGFVQRLNASGSGLVYATYLGGSLNDATTAAAVAGDGSAYFTGWTQSANFPTTEGAYDRSYNGAQSACCGFGDAYVIGLDAAGTTLTYGTFLGGRGDDQGTAVVIRPGSPRNVYVAGFASSLTCCPPTRPFFSDFPVTPSAFDTTFSGIGDGFVARIDPGATGGSGLVWSTFVGGALSDSAQSIALDTAGNAYATGSTVSIDFPTTPGAVSRAFNETQFSSGSAWASWLTADGRRLRWSSLLEGPAGRGNGDDNGFEVVLDGSETAFIVGRTNSTGFPVTRRAFDTTWNGAFGDVFVSKLATTPQAQLDVIGRDLEADVAAGLVTRTQLAGLRAALDAAKRDVERAHARQAVGHLRTFISEVNDAAREGPLTAEEALYFMDEATDVILFVDYWLAGVGGPGPGPASAGPQEPISTVDVLVPAGLGIAPGETLTIGSGDEKADGLEAGCTVGDDVGHAMRTSTVAAPTIGERALGVLVRGDIAAGTSVANLTFVGYCTTAARTYQVFRGNPEG
jgi:hypothetical protein